MGGCVVGIFSAGKAQSKQTPAAGGMTVQTSALGRVRPVVFGTTKIAPNMIWQGDFVATAQSSSGRGGKGGVGGGGGGKGGGGGTQYLYKVALQMGLCEGPIRAVGTVWKDKNITTTTELGMTTFLGTYPQLPWDYMVTNHGKVNLSARVPAAAPYQINIASNTAYLEDFGVVGPPARASYVKVGGAPAAGQYQLTSPYGAKGTTGIGYNFNAADKGKRVIIKYYDGYNRVNTEEKTIPIKVPYQISIYSQSIRGISDGGVTQVNVAYTPVVGAPAADQYSVSGGIYTFNAANANAMITIGYAATNSSPAFEAIGYTGLAHCDVAGYQLGTSPNLSNHNFEIYGFYSDSVPGKNDADPSLVQLGIASDEKWGVGFPAAKWKSLTNYQNYCLAANLLISPAYTEQNAANSVMSDIALATNSEFVWSEGLLNIVPYGDSTITGNGKTYTPPSAPVFDITLDDIVYAEGEDPVKLHRKRVSDCTNSIKLEILDRNNQYSTAPVEAKDQAAIDAYGLRQNTTTNAHMFSDLAMGTTSANLQLQRQFIQNTYDFTLVEMYVVLDPMDIITVPMPDGTRQAVRIKDMDENEDGTISFTAEEYMSGIGSAADYSFQQWGGFKADYNAVPDEPNAPVIFEPTAQLAEALEAWIAVSGNGNWGGADVYVSNDGTNYSWLGRANGSARVGVTQDYMPAVVEQPTGFTIDSTSVVGVDLSESYGELLSASQAEWLAQSTLVWIGGEFMAYQNAELQQENAYDLSNFIRGAYESDITEHPIGSDFVRCDDGILKMPYTQDKIGQTVFIKLLSYNLYGGGQPTIDSVDPYTYTFQGTAYRSPLPDVTNLRQLFVAGLSQIVWDEVQDFRPVQYEIRKGPTADSGQILGRYAHPPFSLVGDDNYWIAAYSQPVPGLQVYSENWIGVSVQGSTLVTNVIEEWDERATGWSGTCTGNAAVNGDEVVTTGTGDFLSVPDFLALEDFLWFGGQGSGIYTIPISHRVPITTPTPCTVVISWTAYGQHPANSFLDWPDFLAVTDFLDLGSSINIDVYPEIRMSQDGGSTWSDWQKYVAGEYIGNDYDARMQLISYDPTVQAHLSEFFFSVDVPDRTDHYTNVSILAAGTAITFKPDNIITPAPFNGGPGSAVVPNIQVTILDAQPGDQLVLTSVTLSGCGLQIVNGGVGVNRNANVTAQGF